MAKTLAAIEAALLVKFSGQLEQKGQFSYAAWQDMAREANTIFGALGYDMYFIETPHREGDGYSCVLRIVVHYFDEDGSRQSKMVDGQGYNELGTGANAIDTAIKGSAADAFKKALSFMGDAFGLSIAADNKAGTTHQRADNVVQNGGGQRQFTGPKDPGAAPTENQLATLRKAGATDEQLSGLTKGEASALIDQVKANGWKMPGTPTKAQVTAARVGTPDDDIFA